MTSAAKQRMRPDNTYVHERMRKDLIEDELRLPIGIGAGVLIGAVVFSVAWFTAVLLTDLQWSTLPPAAVPAIGAIAGGMLGWLFPRTLKAIASTFAMFLP